MKQIGVVYKADGRVFPLFINKKGERKILINGKYKNFNPMKCWKYKIGEIVLDGGE